MTQSAAIGAALLRGEVLSIMSGFKMFACSNLPREISRSIEQKFGVQVSRTRKDFVSQYGQPGFYFEYRLNRTEYNKDGIEKLKEYVKEQLADQPEPKTDKQARIINKQKVWQNALF